MKDQQMEEERNQAPKELPGKVRRSTANPPENRPRLDADLSSETPETYRFIREFNIGGK